jgi:hypothetical protein
MQDPALRRFSNHVFYFAAFNERQFHDDHYHCIACWKKIMEPQYEGTEHEGYVTLHESHYTGFPVMMQYAWVCKECFPRFRETYSWELSTGSVPEIPVEVHRAFSAAYQEFLARKPAQ